MKIVRLAVVLLMGLLLVTAFACSGGGSGQGSTPTPAPAWATYSNSELGISIQYPQDWEKWETGADGATFVSPTADADVKPGIVFVSVMKEESPITLSDHVDEWILGMKLYSPSDNISESSETTVADMPAHKFVVTSTSNEQSLMKRLEIHTIKNNTVYIITYITFESVYPNYLETAQQMIDSFRFE